MPRLAEFYGIVIAMFHNDHPPPHFHAYYAEFVAQVSIEDGSVLEGRLPKRALAIVREWQALHREELRVNWELARAHRTLRRIAPLD